MCNDGPFLGQRAFQPNYCQHCGEKLRPCVVERKNRSACPKCRAVVFSDPKLVVAVIVEMKGQLLLQRRAINPGLGKWTFPSGYVDRGEVLEEAAVRETWEETGILVDIHGLVGVYSETGDPVALAVYRGSPCGGELRPGDEAQEVGWFPRDQLPLLAFCRDRRILEDYWGFVETQSRS